MNLYLTLNLFIIIIPLVLSFERRIRYARKWPAVFFSIGLVGFVYVAWDALATAWGHWSFNPQYVGPIKIFNLPLEEILFFVTTPYSCIFIYEVVSYFHQDKKVVFSKYIIYSCVGILLLGAILFKGQGYTALALISAALFLWFAFKAPGELLFSLNFWIFLGICYVPFLIFNGILTGIPVVEYNPQAIWGARLLSIPLEDFLYNFSYLGFTLLVYKLFLGGHKKV